LAQAGPDWDWVPVYRSFCDLLRDSFTVESSGNSVPECLPGARGHVIRLALHDIQMEVGRNRDPIPLVKEERILEDDAADLVVFFEIK
jgi:hypothetical protein